MKALTSIKSAYAIHVDGYNEADAEVKNNVLAATTAENMAVPSSPIAASVVLLQSDQDVWYNLAATATIPTGDTSDDILLPAGERRFINVKGVTNISLISASAAKVAGLFWL